VATWLLLAGFLITLLTVGPTFAQYYLPVAFNSSWAALVAMLLGIGLFAIRKNALAWYAAVEIVGAAATLIVCAASSYGSSSQRAAALVGGIYFLIRGLDNADRGDLLNKLKELQVRVPPTAVVGATFLLTALFAPTFMEVGRAPPTPPFLAGAYGDRVPVSPLKCGSSFVVCDEAAWRERERLLHATPAERAEAERSANARAEALFGAKIGPPPRQGGQTDSREAASPSPRRQ